jgi:hypothetical protein
MNSTSAPRHFRIAPSLTLLHFRPLELCRTPPIFLACRRGDIQEMRRLFQSREASTHDQDTIGASVMGSCYTGDYPQTPCYCYMAPHNQSHYRSRSGQCGKACRISVPACRLSRRPLTLLLQSIPPLSQRTARMHQPGISTSSFKASRAAFPALQG